jgi:uncharacterized protein (TIGR00296 family)
MGHCDGRSALAEAVPDLALVAALEDPRFRPGDAIAGPFEVEVSVLTPLRRVRGPEDFQIGRHGGLLTLGLKGGLLLPKVARPDWSAIDFLEALSRKSGLPAHGYQDPAAKLSVFEAQVFRRGKS